MSEPSQVHSSLQTTLTVEILLNIDLPGWGGGLHIIIDLNETIYQMLFNIFVPGSLIKNVTWFYNLNEWSKIIKI